MTDIGLNITFTQPLWWLSWNQLADPKYGLDSRPVKWPPPEDVIAFWETGWDGRERFCTVVAIVRAGTESEAKRIVEKAWKPGVGDWRFARQYDERQPPGDRFPPPDWSLELKRWPWTDDENDGVSP